LSRILIFPDVNEAICLVYLFESSLCFSAQ
jgi:hypothetical protein